MAMWPMPRNFGSTRSTATFKPSPLGPKKEGIHQPPIQWSDPFRHPAARCRRALQPPLPDHVPLLRRAVLIDSAPDEERVGLLRIHRERKRAGSYDMDGYINIYLAKHILNLRCPKGALAPEFKPFLVESPPRIPDKISDSIERTQEDKELLVARHNLRWSLCKDLGFDKIPNPWFRTTFPFIPALPSAVLLDNQIAPMDRHYMLEDIKIVSKWMSRTENDWKTLVLIKGSDKMFHVVTEEELERLLPNEIKEQTHSSSNTDPSELPVVNEPSSANVSVRSKRWWFRSASKPPTVNESLSTNVPVKGRRQIQEAFSRFLRWTSKRPLQA